MSPPAPRPQASRAPRPGRFDRALAAILADTARIPAEVRVVLILVWIHLHCLAHGIDCPAACRHSALLPAQPRPQGRRPWSGPRGVLAFARAVAAIDPRTLRAAMRIPRAPAPPPPARPRRSAPASAPAPSARAAAAGLPRAPPGPPTPAATRQRPAGRKPAS